MIKCPYLFSLPRNLRYIGLSVLRVFSVSIRLFYINRQVALKTHGTKGALYPVFLGSEEKQGNKIEVIT